MQTNTFKKMNGTIARLSDLFTEEFKQKLYADCERKDTKKTSDVVELIEQERPMKKVTLANLTTELLGHNAKVLRNIQGLQAQKDYIVARVNALRNVTDAKRNRFLNGYYGRGGVMSAIDFNDLLAILTRTALNGSGLAVPYSRRR